VCNVRIVASLHDKVQNALGEGRILVLGAQVLIGFELRSFFEPRFERLPGWAVALRLLTMCVMLVAFALVALPASYHRLVAAGEDTGAVHRFTTRVMSWALLPLGIGLGLSVGSAVLPATGSGAASVAAAVLAGAIALAAWYAYPLWSRRGGGAPPEERGMEPTSISDKIEHVLTEARMVLPGAQALLGFQLAVTLMESFEKLPPEIRLVHLAALAGVALAVVLLMTPAAYHRIVERGEETERFHRVASRLLLAGMAALALGISADVHVVVTKALGSTPVALAAAAGSLAVFLGLWFGLTLAARARRARSSPRRRTAAAHP
jgi:hypothetical protein